MAEAIDRRTLIRRAAAVGLVLTVGGLFVKRDQGAWVKLHNTSPDSMAAGELD